MLVVTYCSAEKAPQERELPAVERYRSARISSTHRVCERLGLSFRILSGRFGLLRAAEAIPFYDHLLTLDEVDSHSRLVTDQLRAIATDRVVLVSRPLSVDAGVLPYRRSLEQACSRSGIELRIHELREQELRVEELLREP